MQARRRDRDHLTATNYPGEVERLGCAASNRHGIGADPRAAGSAAAAGRAGEMLLAKARTW